MRVKVMACALALAGLVLCGCGGGDDSGATPVSAHRSGELHVYSSLPLQGGNKNQTGAMQKGMELAFDEAGNRAGDTHVRYISLDDSTAQAGNWDAAQTSQNARKAAQDPRASADREAGTIVWPNDADIAPENLYAHAQRGARATRPVCC